MYKNRNSSQMAKKNKKEDKIEETVNTVTTDVKPEEAPVEPKITESEEPKKEKPSKKVIIEDVKGTSKPKEEAKEVAPVAQASVIGVKEIFEKAISVTPFMLFQNNMLLCRWKPNTQIECHEDGFTLNHVKYTYAGIEVKHI